MANNKAITVTVQDTENILFEGEVDRITSFNEVGRFDVYPMHANFISIINQELSLFNNHQLVKKIDLEQAVMKVKADKVSIFLGIEIFSLDDEQRVMENAANASGK